MRTQTGEDPERDPKKNTVTVTVGGAPQRLLWVYTGGCQNPGSQLVKNPFMFVKGTGL